MPNLDNETLYGLVTLPLIATWPGIQGWYYHRLRTRHPATYEELGSPGVFSNAGMRIQWRLMRFLFSSRPRQLNDEPLLNVAWLMRVWIVIATPIIIGILAWVWKVILFR